MNRDRLATLNAWREAAEIERDALGGAQNKIDELIAEREADEYPRSASLASEIQRVEQSILSMLLDWQAEVLDDRESLMAARDALPDDAENERFSALTREIAKADEELLARAEEIEALATPAGV